MPMPSLQSYIFRIVIKKMTGMLGSQDSIENWRKLSAKGSKIPLAKGIALQAEVMNGAPCEWLTPQTAKGKKTILYLHGGGWILGWYNSHRRMVGYLSKACQARALAVDYRLAPEHPFPAALEDCLAAYHGLLKKGISPADIIIAGDSAGGNLTLTVMLALEKYGSPLPVAGVCLSPATDLVPRKASNVVFKNDVGLPPSFIEAVGPAYLADADPRDPLVSPIYGDLRGLPPLLIQAGSEEYLKEDCVRFADRACRAGVDVKLSVYPGMWHVWQIFYPWLPEASQAVNEIRNFVGSVWNS
jgi:monoterpene epsilon-lactone hydrolase